MRLIKERTVGQPQYGRLSRLEFDVVSQAAKERSIESY